MDKFLHGFMPHRNFASWRAGYISALDRGTHKAIVAPSVDVRAEKMWGRQSR